MRLNRRLGLLALVLLLLVGGALAFDHRFLSMASFRNRPIVALFVYAPTLVFGGLALAQSCRRKLWPAFAFGAGLVATGLFHQAVAAESYGNPGYMIPGGHLVAPLFSGVAYSVSFLVAWVIVRVSRNRQERDRGLASKRLDPSE